MQDFHILNNLFPNVWKHNSLVPTSTKDFHKVKKTNSRTQRLSSSLRWRAEMSQLEGSEPPPPLQKPTQVGRVRCFVSSSGSIFCVWVETTELKTGTFQKNTFWSNAALPSFRSPKLLTRKTLLSVLFERRTILEFVPGFSTRLLTFIGCFCWVHGLPKPHARSNYGRNCFPNKKTSNTWKCGILHFELNSLIWQKYRSTGSLLNDRGRNKKRRSSSCFPL